MMEIVIAILLVVIIVLLININAKLPNRIDPVEQALLRDKQRREREQREGSL
ncbi:hypothetical protein [Paenibacillus agaridevorans]|jgi:uncharacterized protein YoxC|nr:hypothetical protein [Paenibacillus agaridevorans]